MAQGDEIGEAISQGAKCRSLAISQCPIQNGAIGSPVCNKHDEAAEVSLKPGGVLPKTAAFVCK